MFYFVTAPSGGNREKQHPAAGLQSRNERAAPEQTPLKY